MYGIPKDINLSFMVSKELYLVCIGPFQISLRFEGGMCIDINGGFKHVCQKANNIPSQNRRVMATSLVSLINTSIESVDVPDDKTLIICFSNKEKLYIYDDSESFETFRIMASDVDIIV